MKGNNTTPLLEASDTKCGTTEYGRNVVIDFETSVYSVFQVKKRRRYGNNSYFNFTFLLLYLSLRSVRDLTKGSSSFESPIKKSPSSPICSRILNPLCIRENGGFILHHHCLSCAHNQTFCRHNSSAVQLPTLHYLPSWQYLCPRGFFLILIWLLNKCAKSEPSKFWIYKGFLFVYSFFLHRFS